MFKTAYETLACRAFDTEEIDRKIKLAQVEQELFPVHVPNTSQYVKGVWAIAPHNNDVPAFTHPFLLKDVESNLFIDGRSYMRQNKDREIQITSPAEYDYQIIRSVLNLHWLEEPIDLLNLGEIAPLVFCRWLSGSVVRRFGLDPVDHNRVLVVTLFYWYSLFRDSNQPFEEKEKMRIVTKLTQITGIPASFAMPWVDEIPIMPSIEAYTSAVQAVVQSSRVNGFRPAFLFAALGGSWYGSNASETIAVATEHPPTFIAMILFALEDRSYRRSGIGQMVQTYDKRDRGSNFIKSARHLINQHMEG